MIKAETLYIREVMIKAIHGVVYDVHTEKTKVRLYRALTAREAQAYMLGVSIGNKK